MIPRTNVYVLLLNLSLFLSSIAIQAKEKNPPTFGEFETLEEDGGWAKEKTNFYVKLSAWYLEADEHFTEGTDTAPNTTQSLFNINVYGEYGITDRWTAILYAPFFTRATENDRISKATGGVLSEGGSINTIGDIDIAIKYGIIQNGKIALSAMLLLGLPTGESTPGGPNNTLQTGDGEFNQMLRADLGIPLISGTTNVYGNVYAGYNNRTNDFSDELRLGAELGLGILDSKWWIIAKADAIQSMNNGVPAIASTSNSIFVNNAEVFSVTLETAVYLTKSIGLSAALTNPISGQLVYSDPAYSAGIFLDVK